jgi:hypothetical protein
VTKKGDEIGRGCRMYGEEEKFTQASVRKLQGKMPLERTKHKWKDNIEIYLKTLGRESV